MVLRTLIAVGVMSVLLGSPALGEPIIFDNRNGEFEWSYFCYCKPPSGTFVDVTQSPSQSGESSDTNFGLLYLPEVATPHWVTRWLTNADDFPPDMIQVAADDVATVLVDETGIPTDFYFARELGPGDIVDGGMNMRHSGALWVFNPGGPFPEVLEMIDTPTFIGVSFIRNAQLHYGWILVDTITFEINFEPLMWAYESTPDTPIVIPDLSCPADIDGDGTVGINDFLGLLAAWGPNPGHPADLDGDGDVGINDFLALLANWGPCP